MMTRIPVVSLLFLFAASGDAAQSTNPGLMREESSVTYRMVHPLHKIESTSKDVAYKLDIDVATRTVKQVSAQVDVTTFDSGNSNRDSHAMEVIDAISYPEAQFVSTGIVQAGDSLSIAGKLTFHGVTKDVMAAARCQWSQSKLSVNGSLDVSLTGFNIERPSLLMIPVEDKLSFTFVAVFALEKK
jgi:polyisoprenoid-binding protein YceI